MPLLKIIGGLIGVTVFLGGLAASAWSVVLFIERFSYQSAGPHEAGQVVNPAPDLVAAVALLGGGILAIYIGTLLGRFARGDFD